MLNVVILFCVSDAPKMMVILRVIVTMRKKMGCVGGGDGRMDGTAEGWMGGLVWMGNVNTDDDVS